MQRGGEAETRASRRAARCASQDFTSLFDDNLFRFDTSLIPEARHISAESRLYLGCISAVPEARQRGPRVTQRASHAVEMYKLQVTS